MKIDRWLSWSKLASVAKLKIVKTSYVWVFIVPTFAKLLSKINDGTSMVFNMFGQDVELVLKLPFSWSVLFFSALSFLVGYLVYIYACPEIIKDHPTFTSFTSQGKNLSHLFGYEGEIDAISENSNGENVNSYKSPFKDRTEKKDYYWDIFNRANHLRMNYRWASGIPFGIGFLLIGILIFQNTISVVKNLFII